MKKCGAALLFLLVGALFLSNGVVSAAAFQNPSFKNGRDSWMGPGDCSAGRSGEARLEERLLLGAMNDRANAWEITAQNHLACVNTKIAGLSPGELYRISFLSKSSDDGGVDVNLYSGNHFAKFQQSVDTLPNGWRRRNFVFRMDQALNDATFMVYIDPGNGLRRVALTNFEVHDLFWRGKRLWRGLLIVLGLAAIAVFRKKATAHFFRMLAAKFALLVCGIFVALFVADIVCYRAGAGLEDWQVKYNRIARKKGFVIDRKNPEEAILDEWRRGKDTLPYYPPGYFMGEPDLAFYVPAAPDTNLLYCNENGYFMRFHTDHRGFNNPPETESITSPDYAFLGDSFTFGACVNQGLNFVDRVRQHYPNTLNFGLPASGPLLQYVVYREFVENLRPKVLVWNFISNDFSDLEHEMQSPAAMRYVSDPNYRLPFSNDGRGVKLRALYKAKFLETNKAALPKLRQNMFLKTIQLFHLRALLKKTDFSVATVNLIQALKSGAPPPVPTAQPLANVKPVSIDAQVLNTYRWLVADLNRRVKAGGGQLYIYFDDYYAASSAFPVRAIATEMNIPIIDISQIVQKEVVAYSVPVFRPGHYSEMGFARVGDLLSEELSKLPVREKK